MRLPPLNYSFLDASKGKMLTNSFLNRMPAIRTNHIELWFIAKITVLQPKQQAPEQTEEKPFGDERHQCRDNHPCCNLWETVLWDKFPPEMAPNFWDIDAAVSKQPCRAIPSHQCFRRATGLTLRFQSSTFFIPSKNTLHYTSWPPYGVGNLWNGLSLIVVRHKTVYLITSHRSFRMSRLGGSCFVPILWTGHRTLSMY